MAGTCHKKGKCLVSKGPGNKMGLFLVSLFQTFQVRTS